MEPIKKQINKLVEPIRFFVLVDEITLTLYHQVWHAVSNTQSHDTRQLYQSIATQTTYDVQ